MGALPVTLERIEKSGEDTWYFYGENFTASSRVEVNEEIQDTVYVSPSILMVHSLTLEDGDQITIAQQSNSSTKKVLTRTEPMMYEEPKTVSTPTPTPNPDSTKTDVTQENANTSTAPQDELTAAPSGAPEGEGDKIEPSKTENSDKPAEDGGGADFDVPLYLFTGKVEKSGQNFENCYGHIRSLDYNDTRV